MTDTEELKIVASEPTNPDLTRTFFRNIEADISKYRTLHHLFVFPNETDFEDFLNNQNLELIYKKYPFVCSQVIPVSESVFKDITKIPKDILKQKADWSRMIMLFKSCYRKQKLKKKYRGIDLTKKGSAIIPLCLWKFVKLMNEDPDKYFNSHYNWYYTGNGNLSQSEHNNESFIFQSVDDSIKSYTFEDRKLINRGTHSLKNDELIYETRTHQYSSQCIVGVRQRKGIFLLQYDQTSDSPFTELGYKNTKTRFDSFDFYENEICYHQVDGSISISDFEFNSIYTLKKPKKDFKCDNRAPVQFKDNNLITQTTKSGIDIFDKRIQDKCSSLKNPYNFSCDDYCLSKHFGENYLYVSSLHSLYLYDLRSLKDKKDPTCLMKWSHGCKLRPLFISIEKFEDKMVAALSSTNLDEVITMVYDDSNFYTPYAPESISKSLYEAQTKGYCLDIAFNYKARFSLPSTGVLLRKNSHGLDLFNSNTAGDVFHQYLSTNNLDEISNDPQVIEEWFSQMKIESIPFTVSNIIDAQRMRKKAIDTRPITIPIKKIKNVTQMRSWKLFGEKIRKYRDMCSGELLSAWDITDIQEEKPSTLMDTKFNVSSWMQDNRNFIGEEEDHNLMDEEASV